MNTCIDDTYKVDYSENEFEWSYMLEIPDSVYELPEDEKNTVLDEIFSDDDNYEYIGECMLSLCSHWEFKFYQKFTEGLWQIEADYGVSLVVDSLFDRYSFELEWDWDYEWEELRIPLSLEDKPYYNALCELLQIAGDYATEELRIDFGKWRSDKYRNLYAERYGEEE